MTRCGHGSILMVAELLPQTIRKSAWPVRVRRLCCPTGVPLG
jgi:hypothetical protein